jgi:flagellar biosynthesis regulator FlbT
LLALQLAYVEPEHVTVHLALYDTLAAEVRAAAPSTGPMLDRIDEHVKAGRHYQALKSGRTLLDYERELISHVR